MTKYACPGCGDTDPDSFYAVYDCASTTRRKWSINGGRDDDGENIVDDECPETDWHSDSSDGDSDSSNDEFQHYECTNCHEEFGTFNEIDEDDEDEDEEDDEDEPTLLGYLHECNTDEEEEVRKTLDRALADDELTVPSDVVSAVRHALDNHASLEQLVNHLNRIRKQT